VKGREWLHVVLHHATAGLLPHRLADDLEEERRVFHVALTRCRLSVSIICGTPPSPFVLELDEPGEAPSNSPELPLARRSETDAKQALARREATEFSEMVPAALGLAFNYRGHDCEVIELMDYAVRALLAGGPANSVVPFGTAVSFEGRLAMMCHPRFGEAWETLRAWRADRAKAMGKPAFVIFDDKTLRLVSAKLPTTESGLLEISGIGPVKLESYGDELIAVAEQLRALEAPGS
jgi:superfamily II DNA helicase RecQ